MQKHSKSMLSYRCLFRHEGRLHLNNGQFLLITTWRVDFLFPESIELLTHESLSSSEMKSRQPSSAKILP